VGDDVAPTAASPVAPQEMSQALEPARQRRSAHDAAQNVAIARGETQRRDEVVGRQIAVDIGFRKADVAANSEAA
jgi:hypothetical protein